MNQTIPTASEYLQELQYFLINRLKNVATELSYKKPNPSMNSLAL